MTEESFIERLRRLRRDSVRPEGGTGKESAEAQLPSKVGPEWLRERLGRRRSRHRPGTPDSLSPQMSQNAQHVRTEGLPEGLVRRSGPRGPFGERITLRPDSDVHGGFRFDEVDGATDLEMLCRDAALKDLNPRALVYLDIETTGLSGGAGTWPFMVALGRFIGDKFELWQGFMCDPSEEPGLLEETARRIADSHGVVSFFGKSFDRHRLEDKMRIHGIESPFEGCPHLDLYHPLNRLYAQRSVWDRYARGAAAPDGAGLADAKLATMECALLGLRRELDLSGAHAPAAWFDFLAHRPHLLVQVFRHNALDVWSLVALLAHLGCTLSGVRVNGQTLSGPKLARELGLATLARDRSDRQVEIEHLASARALMDAFQWPPELALWHANAQRLFGATTEALLGYVDLEAACTASDSVRAAAAVERAKLLEHQEGDFEAALIACESARQAAIASRKGSRFLADLDHRTRRLTSKLGVLPSSD